jgi:hypothetical protein
MNVIETTRQLSPDAVFVCRLTKFAVMRHELTLKELNWFATFDQPRRVMRRSAPATT